MIRTIIALLLISSPLIAETMETYASQENGFSIDFPTTWEKKQGLMGIDVMAFAPFDSPEDILRENTNILVSTLETSMTSKEFVRQNLDGLEQILTDFVLEDQQEITLDGVKGTMILYRHKYNEIPLQVAQYLILVDNQAYIITFSSTPQDFPSYKPTFDAIIKSFKLPKTDPM